MASALLRKGFLLVFLLLCLVVLYAGWSRNKKNQDARKDDNKDWRLSFADKLAVESSRIRRGSRGGGREWGSGADRRQFINELMKYFDMEEAAFMQQLVARKATSRDPQLIDMVHGRIDPPPPKGKKMLVDHRAITFQTLQSREVDALLIQQRNGFFIECGAFDGEAYSNSLPFEHIRNWTGLLIEVSPYFYKQILGKNRDVWTLNACLSPYNYATQLQFEENGNQLGRVKLNDDGVHKNLSSSGGKDKKKKLDVVPCFPLETILLALNRTRVDYFSLDVEGLELEVLKTIPFDRIDIRVLTVEYKHGKGGKDAIKSFMESKGFRTYKDLKGHFVEDYLFVKK